jgi:hypothetical protein
MTQQELSKKLSDLFKKAAQTMPLFLAKVITIDKNKYTCSVQPVDEAISTRFNVRLLPVETEEEQQKGLVLFPAQDSLVLCAKFDQDESFILSVFEIESVLWLVGEAFKMSIDNQGNAVFNDGQNQGLVIAPELKVQVDKNTAILDAIKIVLEGVSIPEPGNGAPSALQAALKIATQGKETADLSNIQNTKIKH